MSNVPTYTFATYQVFNEANLGFTGNVAAVIETSEKFSSAQMQKSAKEFNLPATTYLHREKDSHHWNVRWFAPDSEIELCGHGAMAAIAYLTDKYHLPKITLHYEKGSMQGHSPKSASVALILRPINDARRATPEKALIEGLGIEIEEYYTTSNKNIVLVKSEQLVRNMSPDFQRLKDCKDFGFVVTAPGDEVDFVSRTLVPHVQQLEDPATGSSHVVLAPFWSKRLNKKIMTAHQLSHRGGRFLCSLDDNMVVLTGNYQRLAQGTWRTDRSV